MAVERAIPFQRSPREIRQEIAEVVRVGKVRQAQEVLGYLASKNGLTIENVWISPRGKKDSRRNKTIEDFLIWNLGVPLGLNISEVSSVLRKDRSTVLHHIKKLEQKLGVPIRTSNGSIV